MEVGASAIAFLGLATQVAAGLSKLYDFLQDLKEAPEVAKKLTRELELLKDIISTFTLNQGDGSFITSSTRDAVQDALHMVRDRSDTLYTLLRKSLSTPSSSRAKKLWDNANAVFQNTKVTKLITELERAKRMLQWAFQAVERDRGAEHTRMLSELLVRSSFIASTVSKPPSLAQQSLLPDNNITKTSQVSSHSALYKTTTSTAHEVEEADDVTTSILGEALENDSIKARLLRPYIKKLIEDALEEQHQARKLQSKIDRQSRSEDNFSAPALHYRRPPAFLDESDTATSLAAREAGSCRTLVVSKGQQIRTVLSRPWVGAVTVKSNSSITKAWNDDLQSYQTQKECWETTVHLRLAQWLTDRAFDIRFEDLVVMNMAPKLGISLEPVRYARMPLAITRAINQGNLGALKEVLSNRELYLRDRCSRSGYNILELSFQALMADWFESAMDNRPRNDTNIIGTCQWLLSQGLSVDDPEEVGILKDQLFLDVSHDLGGKASAKVYELVNVLVDSTANASSIVRARMFILLVLTNPEHPLQLEATIWDLVAEGASSNEFEYLGDIEHNFWSSNNTDDPFMLGMEVVVLLSMLNSSNKSKPITTADIDRDSSKKILAGPRKLIVGFMSMSLRDPSEPQAAIPYTATLLRLCKPMHILEDGFGSFVSKFACRNQILDMWQDMLKLAHFPAVDIVSEHLACEQHIQPCIRISLGYEDTEESRGSSQRFAMFVEDPHAGPDQMLDHEMIDSWHTWYDSHSAASPDLCQVRQEGSQLFFDCDIMKAPPLGDDIWKEERHYWSSLEADGEYYTKVDLESTSCNIDGEGGLVPQQQGWLPRLVSDGVSIITGMV